jgi:hypothetical protein
VSAAIASDERGHAVRNPWQWFGWRELDEAATLDDDFGRSESIDPDNVGDIADEGAGHRG